MRYVGNGTSLNTKYSFVSYIPCTCTLKLILYGIFCVLCMKHSFSMWNFPLHVTIPEVSDFELF